MQTVSRRLLIPTILLLALTPCIARQASDLTLPPPKLSAKATLNDALSQRKTTREFKPDPLSLQELSNLLWAGFGINRPTTGQRTAPSAMNSQEVDLYVALPQGLYLYDAKTNRLVKCLDGDLRPKTGGQAFIKQAPAVLIYVADFARLTKAKPESKQFYAAVDTGCIVQNVYLGCAAEGLGAVVFDLERPPLAEALKLGPDQKIILAQAIGHP